MCLTLLDLPRQENSRPDSKLASSLLPVETLVGLPGFIKVQAICHRGRLKNWLDKGWED